MGSNMVPLDFQCRVFLLVFNSNHRPRTHLLGTVHARNAKFVLGALRLQGKKILYATLVVKNGVIEFQTLNNKCIPYLDPRAAQKWCH